MAVTQEQSTNIPTFSRKVVLPYILTGDHLMDSCKMVCAPNIPTTLLLFLVVRQLAKQILLPSFFGLRAIMIVAV